MARYTGPVCRQCRREGLKLYLKGEKCYSTSCPFLTKPVPPGQHGRRRSKSSEYGTQLREKQKVKRYYGLLEKQFRHYFALANKMEGITGENLLQLLEQRLDNTVYRLGLASSRKEARQLVNHGHFLVNGQKTTIPSYQVKVGDTIEVKDKSKSSPKFKELREKAEDAVIVPWLNLDTDNLKGTVINTPSRDDIDIDISEHLIVELYSK